MIWKVIFLSIFVDSAICCELNIVDQFFEKLEDTFLFINGYRINYKLKDRNDIDINGALAPYNVTGLVRDNDGQKLLYIDLSNSGSIKALKIMTSGLLSLYCRGNIKIEDIDIEASNIIIDFRKSNVKIENFNINRKGRSFFIYNKDLSENMWSWGFKQTKAKAESNPEDTCKAIALESLMGNLFLSD